MLGPRSGAGERGESSTMRILIAEDESVSRLVLHRAVEQLGHACLVATDGEEAWARYRGAEIDVVISDWMMPGLDGIELCRLVRDQPRDTYTYFILLTALEDKRFFLAGMEAGADDYLTKPLDRDELYVRLLAAERVTKLHRQLAESRAELERTNRALFESARTDPLTGLGNRLRLHEDLRALEAAVERYGHSYCAALFDVDQFKSYNDRYGHLAGDQVLRTVAQVVTSHCRAGDTAYRYGGEEFLVILPEQSLDAATVAVERLRSAVETLRIPHVDNLPGRVLTISGGLAMLGPGERLGSEAWLARADLALYLAKRSGRNRVATHQDTVLAAS